jgi:hypothetical protein
MRAGANTIPWTTEEERWLKENAGSIPIRDVCQHLHRSRSSVESKAHRMELSLRHYEADMVWCDTCSTWRTEVDADGRCPVCKLRHQSEGRKDDYRTALDAMTPAQRARHLHNEAAREQKLQQQREKRAYNAWKKRVERAREVTGTNPRKSQTNARKQCEIDQ